MEQQRNVPPPFVLDAIKLAKDTITYCISANKWEDRLAVGVETIRALDSILEQYEDKGKEKPNDKTTTQTSAH